MFIQKQPPLFPWAVIKAERETGLELQITVRWVEGRGHHLRFGTCGNATFEPGYKVSEKGCVVHHFCYLQKPKRVFKINFTGFIF